MTHGIVTLNYHKMKFQRKKANNQKKKRVIKN